MNFLGKYHRRFGVISCSSVSLGPTQALFSDVLDNGSGGSYMEGPPRRSTSHQNMDYVQGADAVHMEYMEHMEYMDDAERKEFKCSRLYDNESSYNDSKQLLNMKMDRIVDAEKVHGIYPSFTAVCSKAPLCNDPRDYECVEAYENADIHIGMLSDFDNDEPQDALPNDKDDDNNDGPQGHGQGNTEVSVRTQVFNFVTGAAETYNKFKDSVATANAMLKAMHHPSEMISEDMMSVLQVYLVDNPEWLVTVFEGKDECIEQLRRDLYDVRMEREEALFEAEQSQKKLEK
uniref:Uncharacterized protein n=1 Tax=Panagrolaimus sp. ES5 TaxID=591445 RepID=A0AC34GDB2_9BILA